MKIKMLRRRVIASIFLFFFCFSITMLAQERSPELNRGNDHWCGYGQITEIGKSFSNLRTSESQYLNYSRVNPIVIRANTDDTFTLEVGVKDENIVGISGKDSRTDWALTYQGQIPTEFIFYDDGTHGDRLANDQIFTLNELAGGTGIEWGRIFARDVRMLQFDFTFTYKNGSINVANETLPTHIYTINPDIVPIPKVFKVAEDVYATQHAVNIVLPEIEGEYPDQHFIDPNTISINYWAKGYSGPVQRYYQIFPDDKDFIALYPMVSNVSGYAARYLSVQNDVEGMGGVFSNPIVQNQSAQLKGIVEIWVDGINPFYIYNHEILHRWAAFLDPSLQLSKDAHWDFISKPSSGFGTSFFTFFSKETDTTYVGGVASEKVNSSLYFNDLELYLMGLLPPASISEPIETLVNAYIDGPGYDNGLYSNDPNYQWFVPIKAESRKEVYMSEIISVMGERKPAFKDAQKDFGVATIIPYDRPLNEVEMAYFEFLMSEYEKSISEFGVSQDERSVTFEEAIQGRGTMSTSLDLSVWDSTAPVTFELNSPQDGEILYNNKPTLIWDASNDDKTGINRYEVWINGEKYKDVSASETSVTIENALENGDYNWFVKAIDFASNSTTSNSSRNFTIEKNPSAPTISSVNINPNPAKAGPVNIEINIDPVVGQIDYTKVPVVKLISSTNLDEYVVKQLAFANNSWSGQVEIMGNMSNGFAHISVSGVHNSLGNEMEKIDSVATLVIDTIEPNEFDLLSPNDGAWFSNEVIELVWETTDDATSRLSGFKLYINSELISEYISGKQTSMELANSFVDGSYIWNVDAIDEVGNSRSSSSSWSFQVDNTAPVSVITGTNFNNGTGTLTIEGSTNDHIGIGVDSVLISSDKGSTWQLTTSMAQDFSLWEYQLSNLVDEAIAIEIQAIDKLGNKENVHEYTFNLVTGVNEKIKVETFHLSQNYPNPFHSETNIEYQVSTKSLVQLKVYNALGIQIKTLVNENQDPGVHNAFWDGIGENGQKVSPGLYLYRINSNGYELTKSLIVD